MITNPHPVPAAWPDAKTEAEMLASAQTGWDVDCHIKALLARVRELEAERDRLYESLNQFAGVALCTKKRNTPKFMAQLADAINTALAALGNDSSVKYPGDWSNEFHYEIGGKP